MLGIAEIVTALRETVWNRDLAPMSLWRRRLVQLLRGVHVVARDVNDGQLTLQAMGLVYTTLLSLVPLLAVSFSVLKAFGVHNQIEPFLLRVLAPLGDKANEITARIIDFVGHIKVGVLGALGLGLLIYTVASLVQKIESAFNYTWHVSQTRTFTQRFSQYLSVLTVGPVLVFAAMGLTATLMNASVIKQLVAIEPLGSVVKIVGDLVPYVLVIAAFTFAYEFIPNARVRVRSALIGGIFAGIAWQAGGWLFAVFVVDSTQYSAIYSGFAILVVFMIWLYLSWLILLIGASIAFYHQHPESLTPHHRELRLSARAHERLTLTLMTLISRNFYAGRPPWTVEGLARRTSTPAMYIAAVIDTLAGSGLLARTADDPPCYLPARPLDSIPIKTLLDVVRSADGHGLGRLDRIPLPEEPHVEELVQRMDQALENSLRGKTLKDLAVSIEEVTREKTTASR